MNATHTPVMVAEVLEMLDLKPGMTVIDGTVGHAGHSLEMAQKLQPKGKIYGFDWDASMLDVATARISGCKGIEFTGIHADYRYIPEYCRANCLSPDGILLDMGLNNAQIEDPQRGITFLHDGPLDMRLDRSHGEPASALLNRWSAGQIEKVLRTFGDENWAKKISEIIVDRRKVKPLRTTSDLVDCVYAAIPPSNRDKRIHPATRTFQAVRIAVNRELDELGEAIEDIAGTLKPGGRFVLLSYHSGEDRAAKAALKNLAEAGFEILTKKPLTPTPEEISKNNKARSAKLRALKRRTKE